jgi:hypothetical protein
MDWNRIEGNWKQFKGKIKEQWGHLTDDDLDAPERMYASSARRRGPPLARRGLRRELLKKESPARSAIASKKGTNHG